MTPSDMIDMNDFDALCSALRRHPKCSALIVWQPADCASIGVDPDLVGWKYVEERGIEVGWVAIEGYRE